jgi:hypothetical protein
VITEIQKQLAELIQENSRGSTALFDAEKALAEAEYALDTAEQKSYIKAQGTVRDREAIAKLESADLRLARDLRKAELNRIKQKIRAIETASMVLATQAKLMQQESRL